MQYHIYSRSTIKHDKTKGWGQWASRTQDNPAVGAVQVEDPGAGDFGSVLHVLLQALAVDLQGVLVGEAADCVDVDGGLGV